ncbi:NifU family protein [Micrococcus porci]|uniref:NifU family protein n=1 Tax=Micrococcus porci TaxID=2856555 RepID=UPI003CE70D57
MTGAERNGAVAAHPVPTHPEAVPGDRATLRWAVPAGLLGMVGPVGDCPAPLEALRADGTLRALVAEPAALRLTVGEGRTWRAEGARVRAALQEALALLAAGEATCAPEAPAGVVGGPGGGGEARAVACAGATADPDAVLRAAVEQVLAGPAGEYLRSHGGTARILGVEDGEVELALGGTCHACPARGFTLQMRLEAEIRRLCPDVRAVRMA